MPIVSDLLNDTDDTLLTSHVPTLGSVWEQVFGPAGSARIRGNGLFLVAGDYTWSVYRLKKAGGYGTADYDARSAYKFANNVAGSYYVAARVTGSGAECYAGGWERGRGWRIVKFDAAGDDPTVLAQFDAPDYPPGVSPEDVELIPYGTGASVKLFLRVLGSVIATAIDTDAPYTTGEAGFAAYTVDGDVPPFGTYFDDFTVDLVPTGAFVGTLTTQPADAASGLAMTQAGIVEVQDITGARITTDTRTFTVSLEVLSGSGSITAGTLTKTAVGGIANFNGNGILITGSGRGRLVYDGGSIGKAYSETFVFTPTPTKITILQTGSGFGSRVACLIPFIVAATDDAGNVDTTWEGKLTADVPGGTSATVHGPNVLDMTGRNGVGTFYRLKLVGPGQTTPVTFTAEPWDSHPALAPATSTAITIGPQTGSFATLADGSLSLAELPRFLPEPPEFVADVVRSVTGATLQAALDADALLDETHGGNLNYDYQLTDGVGYDVGSWTWPCRPPNVTGWQRVRCSSPLPTVRGTRTAKADLGTRGGLVSDSGNFVFNSAPASGGMLPHHQMYAGIYIGALPNTDPFFLLAYGTSGTDQNTLAKIPHHHHLDRCVVDGGPTNSIQHGFLPWCNYASIYDSSMLDLHSRSSDGGHAISLMNGGGPFAAINNTLECSGVIILAGGGDPSVPGLVPRDNTIRQNLVTRKLIWNHAVSGSAGWLTKNNLDLKNTERTLVEGNIFENCWDDTAYGGQGGSCTNLKSVNQDGSAPWCGTTDLTFRRNFLRNAVTALSLAGNPEQWTGRAAVGLACVLIQDICAVNISGVYTSCYGDTFDVTYDHATPYFDPAGSNNETLHLGRAPGVNYRFRFTHALSATDTNGTGILGDPVDAIDGFDRGYYAPSGTITKNGLSGATPGFEMTDAQYAAKGAPGNWLDGVTPASFGFVDRSGIASWATADPLDVVAALTLSGTSIYRAGAARQASDGTDNGCDMAALAAALNGTYTPPDPPPPTSDGSPSVPDAMSIIQNSTSPILFYMSDSTDSTGRTPKTGLSPTVTLSKAGSAFAAAAGTVAEISGGWYKLTPTTADTGTLGDLGIHASAAGADDWNDLRRVVTGVRTDLATELADIVSSLDAPVSSRATPAQTAAAVLANPSYKLVTDGAGHVALAAASITAFLDSVIETNGGATLTMRQALSAGASLALGAISGITDGVGTEVVTLRSATGQIIATFLTDGVGNRTPTITYPA